MKNNVETLIETPVKWNLAVIKRIDELPGWKKTVGQKSHEIVREKNSGDLFETWIMPEQPEGYIKAKANDFL